MILLLWLLDYGLNPVSVKTLDSIRSELLSFLEIVALFLLIIVLVAIISWILRSPEGIVILPFEIVALDDKSKLSCYNGKSIADSLTADMITILNIHKQQQIEDNEKKKDESAEPIPNYNSIKGEQVDDIGSQNNSGTSSQNLLTKSAGKFTTSEFISIGENLDAGFADIGNITVSGNSISLGKILLTLKKLWNDRDPKYVISGSIQKYGNLTRLVSRLKATGEKNIVICEVHKTIQTEDEIPDLIKDLAFNIWQSIPKGWNDINGTNSKTWGGLKYFTEALSYYNQYKLSRSKEHLDNAFTNCLKASQEEKGYTSLFDLAYRLGIEKYQVQEYDNALEIFKCAGDIVYDAYNAYILSPDEFKTKAVNAHNAIGSCFLYQRLYPGAEFNFRKAIDLKPDEVDSYYNLSLVLVDLNRREEALDVLNEVIKLKDMLIEEKDKRIQNLEETIHILRETMEEYQAKKKS